MAEVVDLTTRTAHEQELFSFDDWQFIQWLAETHADPEGLWKSLVLTGMELLQWLVRWGGNGRLRLAQTGEPMSFRGQLAQLQPHLETANGESAFHPSVASCPAVRRHPLSDVKFFAGRPAMALVGSALLLAAQRAAGRVAQRLGAKEIASGQQIEPPAC